MDVKKKEVNNSPEYNAVVDRLTQLESENKKLQHTNISLSEEIKKGKKALNVLQNSIAGKSRFISQSSHEFRTPLTSILTSVEILELVGRECDEKKYFQNIHRIKVSVMYMTELMDDVIAFNRMERGEWLFKPEKTNLYDFFIKYLEVLNDNDHNQHFINFNFKAKKEACYEIDQKLIQHIFSNLISNAFKYSEKGKSIDLEVEECDDTLFFYVRDYGIGISEEDVPNIYSAFFRGQNTKGISGTGLGLAIAKKATETHGGEVSFESKEGNGTLFKVRIPVNGKCFGI